MSLDAAAATSIAHYYDRRFGRPAVKIFPGDYFVCADDAMIVTTLGSCVSACIHDASLGLGGMNHFMLPTQNAANEDAPFSVATRYGIHAMEILINEILKRGGRRERLSAKVFGGAELIGDETIRVGVKNSEFVLAYLGRERIPVVAQDLLGARARTVHFFPDTGRAQVRYLRSLRRDPVRAREIAYESSIPASLVPQADMF